MILNELEKWKEKHWKNVLNELKEASIELIEENIPKIIKETSFENRSKKYKNKCPYYKLEYSCHQEIKNLNCMLCACPEYNSDSDVGGCNINSGNGRWTYHEKLPKGKVWDCSYCNKFHSPKEVEEFLKQKLNELQRGCYKI